MVREVHLWVDRTFRADSTADSMASCTVWSTRSSSWCTANLASWVKIRFSKPRVSVTEWAFQHPSKASAEHQQSKHQRSWVSASLGTATHAQCLLRTTCDTQTVVHINRLCPHSSEQTRNAIVYPMFKFVLFICLNALTLLPAIASSELASPL